MDVSKMLIRIRKEKKEQWKERKGGRKREEGREEERGRKGEREREAEGRGREAGSQGGRL